MDNAFREKGDPEDGKDSQQVYKDTPSTNSDLQDEQIVSRIPLYDEDFELTKKEVETNIQLEKKWVHTTKKIEIPIKYEEILLNGKEFSSYEQKEIVEMLSKIKHKISHVFHHDAEDSKNNKDDSQTENKSDKQKSDNHDHHHENSELDVHYTKQGSKKETHNSSSAPSVSTNGNNTSQFERVIPLWGEEITVTRKIVKLGEIIVRKYQISENHEVKVELNKEKYSVKYPNGFDVQEK